VTPVEIWTSAERSTFQPAQVVQYSVGADILGSTCPEFERRPRWQQQVAQDNSLEPCRYGFAVAAAGASDLHGPSSVSAASKAARVRLRMHLLRQLSNPRGGLVPPE
jgi:hypothetical protein